MKKRFLIHSIVCLLSVFFIGGCIVNDIPYPKIVADIKAFEVSGQIGASVIDTENRTVKVDVADSVDLSNVIVKRFEVTNDADVLPEISTVINLEFPTTYTLTTYQDYLWTISAEQKIDRFIRVENQVGEAEFDEENYIALVKVTQDQDLRDIRITDIKLGPEGATIHPDPKLVRDFSGIQTFNVKFRNVHELWAIRIINSDIESVKTVAADSRAKSAKFSGRFDGAMESPRFQYKKTSEQEWMSVSTSEVTVDGVNFFTTVKNLDPNTDYIFRAVAGDSYGLDVAFTTEQALQMNNSNFENWFNNGGIWYANSDLSEANYWWDSGNKGASMMKINPTTPEESNVVKGKAARLASSNIVGLLAAGSIYYGKYNKTIGLGAEIFMGRPFESRPNSIKGYYQYDPGKINKAKAPYENLMGITDSCHIYAMLTTWDAPFVVNTTTKTFIDFNDPEIVAFAELKTNESSTSYKEFNLEFVYRKESTKPKILVFVASASKYGDFFTGSTSSLLFLDEIELIY